MVVIGVIGGVASGKSLVCEHFRELGATLLNADREGHAVLDEPAVRDALRSRWGDSIFRADGAVDRPSVARLVFAPPPDGPRDRAFLDRATHPRIGERLLERLAECRRTNDRACVILDAALLLEAGWDRLCDRIVFVDATDDQRRQRAESRGWTAEQWRAREAAQLPLAEKRQRADWIVDNSHSLDETRAQVARIWTEITSAAPTLSSWPP